MVPLNPYKFVFDFVITEGDTEREVRLPIVIMAVSQEEAEVKAQAAWEALLNVLPAGQVGGGCYPDDGDDDE